MRVNKSNCRLHPHRAFVLLVTLVLLIIAALAMTGLCRSAILRAQASNQAETELQRRWAVLSCQISLLPKSEILLRQREEQLGHSIISFRKTIDLGGQRVELIFADESAKANVGMLLQRQGKVQTELTIRRMCLESPMLAGNVHLRWRTEGSLPPQPRTFGEVFENSNPAQLCDDSQGPAPSEVLTCWGDGRANVHRATQEILKEVCEGVLNLSQVNRLMELQHSNPKANLSEYFDKMQLKDQTLNAALTSLTDRSNCYSLWVNCRTQRRRDWSLLVGQLQNGRWKIDQYTW